jgi:GT2 family glycosyltransferase
MTPDISIVIPAYNVAGFIGDAVRSALGQAAVVVEVVVVDDGSTDATVEALAPFAGDARLVVIRQANQGLPGARNTGIRAARGRHVGFLDGDDLWDPGKASRHVALLDADPGLDLTFSWSRVVDEEGRDTGRHNAVPIASIPGGLTFEGLVIENFVGNGSTAVCRREALIRAGLFDPELRRSCEDLDAWLRIAALRDGNIGLVPEVLASYRMRGGQMTRDWRRMAAGWNTVIAKAAAANPARVARVERHARARLERFLAYIAYESGEPAEARRMLLRAWRAAPRSLARDRRAWMTTAAVLAGAVLPASWHGRLAAAAKSMRLHGAARRHADA